MSYRVGRKHEIEYKKVLESRGYQVELAPRGNKFSKQKDFFGLFDGIAIKEHKKPIFFQVKTNTTGGMLKTIENFAQKYPFFECFLIIRYKYARNIKWREIALN